MHAKPLPSLAKTNEGAMVLLGKELQVRFLQAPLVAHLCLVVVALQSHCVLPLKPSAHTGYFTGALAKQHAVDAAIAFVVSF